MPTRRTVDPKESKAPEPVEYTAELAGGKAKMYLCPVCGRSLQAKALMENHIATHGGET